MTTPLDFTALFAAPRTLVVCVTIEGCPWVFTPSGVIPTATATTGSLDPAWWPGVGALTYDLPGESGISPVRDLLDPGHTWEIYRQSDPIKGDVKVDALTFDLFDRYQTIAGQVSGEATQLLSSREGIVGELLAADITATDVNITVQSIGGVPSSGIGFVGREAFIYDGTAPLTLTITSAPAGRGKFGSTARAHRFSRARPPLITFGAPRMLQGRTLRVWACEMIGTTLYDPTLLYLGQVGAGIQRTTKGTRWSIPADPCTEALGRKLPKTSVLVTGIHHRDRTVYSPFALIDCPSGYNWLTADSNSLDFSGYHETWSRFVEAWNRKASLASVQAALSVRENRLAFSVAVSTSTATIRCAFEIHPEGELRADSGRAYWTSANALPPVVAHLNGWLRLPSPDDIAKIPATLVYSYTFGPLGGAATWALTAKCGDEMVTASILERDGGATVPGVRLAPNLPNSIDLQQRVLVTEEQAATLGLVASGNDPVAALRAAGLALDDAYGMVHDEGIDWDAISAAFAAFPLALPSDRSYSLGDGDTLLDRLSHEARLRGMALCVRRGKVSVFRTAAFASTERTSATIVEDDILCDGGDEQGYGGEPIEPEVIDGDRPPATTIVFKLRGGGLYQYTDTTAQADQSDGSTITCDALAHLSPDTLLTADALRLLDGVALQILGALAEPYRIVRLTLGPTFLGLGDGDLVTLTHSRVPTLRGTIGVTEAVCQVQDTRITLWGGKARIVVTLRLEAGDIAGYAPCAWVSAISAAAHAVLTIDTGTGWGTSGFAVDGRDPTDGFAVGDAIVVSEGDTESPMADEAFNVLAVTSTSITLDGTPTAPMRTAAASGTYKCMIRFAAYSSTTTRQKTFLFVADHATGLLGGADAPKRWAA